MTIEDKTVEETAKTIRQYLDPILLRPLSELGLLAKDQISFWRFKNQVRMLEKTKTILDKTGVDPESVNEALTPDLVIPLIESAGESESEELSDMFASLMASAINPSTSETGHPSFAKVLSQMSPLDARVLKFVYDSVNNIVVQTNQGEEIEYLKKNIPVHRQFSISIEKAVTTFGVSHRQMLVVFQNLRRLGLCDQGYDALNFVNRKEILSLTDYGKTLCQLCTQPKI